MRFGTSTPTLKVGSTAVAAIKRGSNRVYDADVAAFQQASNAADVTGILDLVDYLKTESLWDYARFYPMKSSQNAGSGSTVYGLGGLTSNNMTLVNSPTWGSDGVTFDGSTQHGNVGDIFDGGDLAVFARVAFASDVAAATEAITGTYRGDVNQRSFLLARQGADAGDPLAVHRSSDGTGAAAERFDAVDSVPTTADQCYVAQWLASDDRFIWQDKTLRGLTLSSGSNQTSTYNSNQEVFFAAAKQSASASSHSPLQGVGLLYIAGAASAPTTTQRETITDLINAL